MKLLNFKVRNEIRLGVKTEEGIIDGTKVAASIDEVIAGGEDTLKKLSELAYKKIETIGEEKIAFAPCVTKPEKIICIGLNYMSHGEECNMDIPAAPLLFSKFNNALTAHNQVVTLPKSAYKFDYEAELVIVIGKEAANVSKEDALSYVFGYTAGNDLSARDLQFVSGQWLLGKTCDGFAPLGPYLITADEVDPNNLDIKCEVNGVVLQSANTSDMIFDCATIVSYISQYMTLKPGDIIFSGTPSGVMLGYPEGEQVWLKSGDEVAVSVEKIGKLVNVLK
jgi:2-keto-4-pentenoate hydratase/2-oxohepta-3-ene-1,7-dioic acid hydratase in catechol pathway